MSVYEINVCADCYIFLANGEVFDCDGNDITGEISSKIEAWWPFSEFDLVPGDYCDHFSRYRCESCNSDLAGERYQVHAFDR